ncbi:MAG TPA: hypothetical protein VKY24_21785 [Reyranella sp.]|jgi:hypothetical protein|nr:hypothetical protein [Reyranella sp.]
MFGRLIVPACASLALLAGAAWAQSPAPSDKPQGNDAQNNDGMSDQEIQHGPQKLREKLAQDGYSDVKIAPGSYIVSAKDKDGNKVVMMIGPHSMTMMKVPDKDPSQAQVPGTTNDEIIQQ